ncbi:MAG TPA: 50S ribosomal protein L18 [Candidatus Acidoferrum sp.]|nr:50S ribosomal protein L18 [Candidatus Acidoferrum sp.]
MNKAKKLLNLALRKARIRARVVGTTERPRLSVFISNKHVSAQIIDDSQHKTLVSSTTTTTKTASGSLSAKAAWVGADIAKKAKAAKIVRVVLDRGGRQYKIRLQALADAARKEGLEF